MRIMDSRRNCELIVISKLRVALDEAYRQQQFHHKEIDEFMYWQGKVHGLEEALRIVQLYCPGSGTDNIGPRSLGF